MINVCLIHPSHFPPGDNEGERRIYSCQHFHFLLLRGMGFIIGSKQWGAVVCFWVHATSWKSLWEPICHLSLKIHQTLISVAQVIMRGKMKKSMRQVHMHVYAWVQMRCTSIWRIFFPLEEFRMYIHIFFFMYLLVLWLGKCCTYGDICDPWSHVDSHINWWSYVSFHFVIFVSKSSAFCYFCLINLFFFPLCIDISFAFFME